MFGEWRQLRLFEAAPLTRPRAVRAVLESLLMDYRQYDFANAFTQFQGRYLMARGRQSNRSKVSSDSGMPEFINVALPTEDKPRVLEQFPDYNTTANAVIAVLETGYRIGLSYDFQRKSYTCTLTCRNEDSSNYNKAMPSFASDYLTAMKVALYKHFVLLDCEWSRAADLMDSDMMG